MVRPNSCFVFFELSRTFIDIYVDATGLLVTRKVWTDSMDNFEQILWTISDIYWYVQFWSRFSLMPRRKWVGSSGFVELVQRRPLHQRSIAAAICIALLTLDTKLQIANSFNFGNISNVSQIEPILLLIYSILQSQNDQIFFFLLKWNNKQIQKLIALPRT